MDEHEPSDDVMRRSLEVLSNTKCVLCPNVIGISREFQMVRDQEVCAKLKSLGADVLDAPQSVGGMFALVHVECLKNAERFAFGVRIG